MLRLLATIIYWVLRVGFALFVGVSLSVVAYGFWMIGWPLIHALFFVVVLLLGVGLLASLYVWADGHRSEPHR